MRMLLNRYTTGTHGISLLFTMLTFIGTMAVAEVRSVVSSGNKVWFATDVGLLYYDKAQDEWRLISSMSGLSGNSVRDIGIEEGIIWVATDRGVSNSDLRFNDWRSYTTSDGLPDNSVNCIGFSEDYVWIGTDKGPARFDKLLEEWKSYTAIDERVNDLFVDSNSVWFATSEGITRIDMDFDRQTTYTIGETLPSNDVKKCISVGDQIWFVTDSGIVKYEKRLMTWRTYTTADGIVSYLVNKMVIDGNNIWLATKHGISIYDHISDSWSEAIVYNRELPSKNVSDVAMDGNLIWFCTERGVSSYDKTTGKWRHYSSADGLLDDMCDAIFVSGSQVFVLTKKGVSIYDKGTEDWDTYEITMKEGIVGKGLNIFRIDEQGIGFDISDRARTRLSGLSLLELVNTSHFKPQRLDSHELDRKSDIRLKGSLSERRTLVGFYDDVEGDVDYGLTFQGEEKDLFQELTLGEFIAKMRNSNLIKDASLTGANVRLKPSMDGTSFIIEPRYGAQRGDFEADFFIYETGVNIYQLSHKDIIPETETVIADRKPLNRGTDYIIIYPSGLLMFPYEELIEEGTTIEVRYQYEDVGSQKSDIVSLISTGADISKRHYAGVDVLNKADLRLISINASTEIINTGRSFIKIKPELAYSNGHGRSGIAEGLELMTTMPRASLKAQYRWLTRGFEPLGAIETSFGDLERQFELDSQLDAAPWLPVTLQLGHETSRQGLTSTSEAYAKTSATFSRSNYPAISFTCKAGEISDKKTFETNNLTGRTDIRYDLPVSMLPFIRFRRVSIDGYYRGSVVRNKDLIDIEDRADKIKTQTGYARIGISPLERFDISTSYKLSKKMDLCCQMDEYILRSKFSRLLVRSNFSTIPGVISNIYLDNTETFINDHKSSSVENKNRNFFAGLNLIPGTWSHLFEFITLMGRYNSIQQTVQDYGNDSQKERSLRALQIQTDVKPHDMMSFIGTFERSRSLSNELDDIYKYRGEAEFRPSQSYRVIFEYQYEHEYNGSTQERISHLPSIWWESKWSDSWTTRLRSSYQRYNLFLNYRVNERGEILAPGLSFRYVNRELPHRGKIYVNNTISVSINRIERGSEVMSSEVYSLLSGIDWKITINLGIVFRINVSYKDEHTKGQEDALSFGLYLKVIARF